MIIVVLAVLIGFAIYVMTPQERGRVVRFVLNVSRQARDAAHQARSRRDSFGDALTARTPGVLVTPALIGVNAIVFLFMLSGHGPLGSPDTLVSWGANFGPRTTNGEWWRLVTATFVHAGLFHLLVNVVVTAQIGLYLERLVGHVAFATVYMAAGIFAGLVSAAAHPLSVSAGASGAVFGIYGLLFASVLWTLVQRSSVTMPLSALKKIMPVAAVFVLFNLASKSLETGGELMGLITGFACGLVLARGVSDSKPAARRIAAVSAATVAVGVLFALPLRGIVDVRPEIAVVVALEDRTTAAYDAALDRFRQGRLTTDALARMIERTIVPELEAARAHLSSLTGVPRDHQSLVATAEEYLRLRDESWRLRAEALHKSNMVALREADRTEKASLEALDRIRPADLQ